ncbi:MAG TPA: hypothetical protein ENK53_00780 [Thiotrichales bacterium]|nr:hypothetical protein [Thiotrichales bacterium]
MNRFQRNSLLFLLLALVTSVGGYLYFREAYYVSEPAVFSQEVILILIGSIITVFITAMLLNKQTEVEIQKEERIRYLELKSRIYMQLIDHIEDIILSGETTEDDLTRLKFLNHKLSLVASPEVLVQFEDFVEAFMRASRDSDIDAGEADEIMRHLALLTIRIRHDLLGDLDEGQALSEGEIAEQIKTNNALFVRLRPKIKKIKKST